MSHHVILADSIALMSGVITYLLTPWSRVLLEKLTGSAASQEFPRFFGTRMFITVLTIARQRSSLRAGIPLGTLFLTSNTKLLCVVARR